MSTRRTDARFKSRFILRSAALVVPPLVVFAFLWRESVRVESTSWWAVAFFVGWVGVWALLDAALLRNYRCPSCGHRIGNSTRLNRSGRDPIRHYCSRCDIEWDTGLSESSG